MYRWKKPQLHKDQRLYLLRDTQTVLQAVIDTIHHYLGKEKTGKNLLSDPLFNKGLGFPRTERDRLGIRGLVPPSTLDQGEQGEVIMAEYREGWAARAEKEPDDEIIKSGVKPDNIRKWKVLQSLQDRNETLFYRLD